jgi:hypothetical protein
MSDLILKTLETRELKLNTMQLRGFYGKKMRRGSGGGSSGDGFPQLPGDVTRWHFGGLTNEMMAAMDDPRLEDADGKGRFLSFKNFAWKEGSGISDIYPGAIVFDGVDDYGICENFPILTKEKGYTVVVLRQWINNSTNGAYLVSNAINNGALGAFIFERDKDSITYSFGRATKINVNYNNPITYQISNSYNSVEITMGTLLKGNDTLLVGVNYKTDAYLYANVAIWELVFLDHDATEEELTKIKDYFVKTYPWLFPDRAWTVVGKTNEDEDRATIANITGNGNDLVLSNFGFAEGSGYGLYAQNYISYAITNRAVYTKTNSSIHVTKSITAGVNFTESARDVTIPSYRIKVTGIQSGQEMIYRGSNNTFLTNIPSDGIYVLPAVENGSNLGFQFVSYTGDCDITIEQIPEYEGYLVTDGVDDSGRAVGLTISKDFTLVGEWILFSKTSVNAGLSIHPQIHIFNRPEAIQIMFRTAGKTLPVKSLKAICSDGRCYDENWSELKINVGEFTDNKGTLFVASNGTNYAQIAFKNLGIYDNHILSKDDCIKAYNYLQTLKAK